MNNDVYIINRETLCDIADAIRSKIECGETMCCDFAEMIRSILQGEESIKHGVSVRESDASSGKWCDILVVGNMFPSFQAGNTYLKNVVFRGQTDIFRREYDGCTGITNIEFKSTLNHIGEEAFRGCVNLQDFILPDGLLTIGTRAFSKCNPITKINIPASVTSINTEAFENCTNVTELVWNPPAIAELSSTSTSPFVGCSNITKLTFGEGITIIPAGFLYGTNATLGGELVIPDTVTTIGIRAFKGCLMNKVVIPESVTSVKSYSFDGCTGITELVWNPPAIAELSSSSVSPFVGCSNITTLTFGENVTLIGDGFMYNAGATFGGELVIPASVTKIGLRAFRGNNMDTVTFEGTPSSISSSAFESCSNLTTINVPWSEGEVANAPWGATGATINYNS